MKSSQPFRLLTVSLTGGRHSDCLPGLKKTLSASPVAFLSTCFSLCLRFLSPGLFLGWRHRGRLPQILRVLPQSHLGIFYSLNELSYPFWPLLSQLLNNVRLLLLISAGNAQSYYVLRSLVRDSYLAGAFSSFDSFPLSHSRAIPQCQVEATPCILSPFNSHCNTVRKA